MKATALWLIVLCGPAQANISEVKVSSRLTCGIVGTMYRHYHKQGYTLEQMKAYLRAHGISESRVAGAEKCLNG
jgi:hypothetical protein